MNAREASDLRVARLFGRDLDGLAALARNDSAARAELVDRLLPAVRAWARPYAGAGVSSDDLFQDGVVGVLRAVERYRAEKGPFVPWARLWVRQALQQAVAESSRPLRLPTHVLWDMHELKEAREQFMATRKREPSVTELANALGWSVNRVGEVIRAERPAASIEETADLLIEPVSDDAYEKVVTAIAAAQVGPLLLQLTDRERVVLAARTRGLSLHQVGRRLGVSRERVRQIEERALSKLRAGAAT